MKKFLVTLSLVLTTGVASANSAGLTAETVEIFQQQPTSRGADVAGVEGGGDLTTTEIPHSPYVDPKPDAIDRAGRVISTARDIVALGEAIYELVKKGKPSNTTEYAPISIVPKDPMTKEIVDPFDLETCEFPTAKKYRTVIKSGLKEVVRFEYMLTYSAGCSYNGAGKYLQAVELKPISIKTSFGWDVTATMKLSGVMNHGTKADPIVGAMLTLKYSMASWSRALEYNDTIHVTGAGQVKTYSR